MVLSIVLYLIGFIISMLYGYYSGILLHGKDYQFNKSNIIIDIKMSVIWPAIIIVVMIAIILKLVDSFIDKDIQKDEFWFFYFYPFVLMWKNMVQMIKNKIIK